MLHYACKSRQLEVTKLLLERMTRDAVLSLNQVIVGSLAMSVDAVQLFLCLYSIVDPSFVFPISNS